MLQLRDFVNEIGAEYLPLQISPQKWAKIELIKSILYEPYKVTMALQRNDYTLSDLFGDWIRMKHNLQKLHHPMADSVHQCLVKRENILLKHKLMLSTVYLDSRYNFLLSETEKESAVAQLIVLWARLNQLNPSSDQTNIPVNENDTFAMYLREASKVNELEPATASVIVERLKLFLSRPPVNYTTNIMEYWYNIKAEEPELFQLITLLFSVPATQVSVERCFSSLTYIFNNYRARLNPDILTDVLILRLNYDLMNV